MILDPLARCDDNLAMAASARITSSSRKAAEKLAAQKAEEVAKTLQSFAASLLSLDAMSKSATRKATPRNWWRLQAGRFKDDTTFADFVAQAQAARKQEG